MKIERLVLASSLVLFGCVTEQPPAESEPLIDPAATVGVTYPNMDVPTPEVIFENEFIMVQQMLTQPGVWSGEHGHAGNQFVVSFGAGTTQVVTNTEETTRSRVAGEFSWVEAVDEHNHRQISEEPRYVFVATLKASPSYAMGTDPASVTHEGYPEIPGELILNNDLVIVRRFDVEPGQWSGWHTHDGNELTIMLTDQVAAVVVGDEENDASFEERDMIWTDAGVEHNHVNAGESTGSFYVIKLR